MVNLWLIFIKHEESFAFFKSIIVKRWFSSFKNITVKFFSIRDYFKDTYISSNVKKNIKNF